MTQFTVVGDVMVDVTARVDEPVHHASDTMARISLQAGGAGANTARWLAYRGERTSFIGAIGDDPMGEVARSALTADGVKAQLQVCQGIPTGVCIVLVTPDGERTMLPDPGANSHLQSAAVADADLIGHLHLSGYTLLNPRSRAAGLSLLARARHAGSTVSLDPASAAPLAHQPAAITEVLPDVDVLIANRDEAQVLTGHTGVDDALAALSGLVPTVVIKLGSEGAIAMGAGQRARVPAVAASAPDTTGAGDAFAAGFLPSWLARHDLSGALLAGAELAGLAVSRVGAGPPAART